MEQEDVVIKDKMDVQVAVEAWIAASYRIKHFCMMHVSNWTLESIPNPHHLPRDKASMAKNTTDI